MSVTFTGTILKYHHLFGLLSCHVLGLSIYRHCLYSLAIFHILYSFLALAIFFVLPRH